MARFTLNETVTESDIFNHKGGLVTVFIDGIFDGASIKFQAKSDDVGFIQLTDDDFNVADADIISVDKLPSNCDYKIVIVDAVDTTSVDVSTR